MSFISSASGLRRIAAITLRHIGANFDPAFTMSNSARLRTAYFCLRFELGGQVVSSHRSYHDRRRASVPASREFRNLLANLLAARKAAVAVFPLPVVTWGELGDLWDAQVVGGSLRPLTPTLSLKGRGGFFSLLSVTARKGWRNSSPLPLKDSAGEIGRPSLTPQRDPGRNQYRTLAFPSGFPNPRRQS